MPQSEDKTRTSLICGFLGAGKTTFIRSRLRSAGGRTAVLVNEFGSLGLDGAAIRQAADVEVVELPGGCICCSRKLELADTVSYICSRLKPQRMFIEPSGVAETSEILTILSSAALQKYIALDGVITLIDAETFLDYAEPDAFGSFFLDQVINADLVLINKADLVNTHHLTEVKRKAASLNDRALIATTSFGQLSVDVPERLRPAVLNGSAEPVSWEHISLEPVVPMTRAEVEELGKMIAGGHFGTILRAKGILPLTGGTTMQLQVVGRRHRVEKPHADIRPRLVCIGHDLRHQPLEAFLSISGKRNPHPPQSTVLPYELS